MGATKIASALVSVDGQIHASRWAPTQVCQGGAAVLDEIAAQINSLAGEAGGSVAGVGIGTPGQVNSKTGIVANAINLGWASIPLKDEITQRLTRPLPLVIQKDANAS
ncbi:MAG TPA: ROK family protein, partial [Desulfuromonadaceae bacterium]